MTTAAETSLPQSGGGPRRRMPTFVGEGWGLFSPAKICAERNRLAPTLTLPRLGGGGSHEEN